MRTILPVLLENKLYEVEKELAERFSPHHNRSKALSTYYRRMNLDKAAERVEVCGDFLDFRVPIDPAERSKLVHANFCKDRFCPMCAWRRSLKIFGQVSAVTERLKADYDFIFLTLTVRNCSAAELRGRISELSTAFSQRFMKNKHIRNSFCGYFKALEVTRNAETLPCFEFHPHFHCIFAVRKNYFTSRDYLKFQELRQIWKDCLGLDYNPSINVKKIYPDESGSLFEAVAEVAKYAVKSDDYLNGSEAEVESTLFTLISALSGRRLCSFGGVFKDMAAELDLDDVVDGDLVHVEKEETVASAGYIVTYEYFAGEGYKLTYLEKDDFYNVDSG